MNIFEPSKEVKDIDLDVMNALKDFPQDETYGCIYLRVMVNPEDETEIDAFLHAKCSTGNLPKIFASAMEHEPILKDAMLNAVLNHFVLYPKEKPQFLEYLKSAVRMGLEIRETDVRLR